MQMIQVGGLGSNLEGKEGLDAVGSVQTIQAVGPDGAPLGAVKGSIQNVIQKRTHMYTHTCANTHTQLTF